MDGQGEESRVGAGGEDSLVDRESVTEGSISYHDMSLNEAMLLLSYKKVDVLC